jgi:hypothetical protein
MKKLIAVALALAIVAAPSAAVAGKKKKGPKPYVSDTVSIAAGHTMATSASGTLVSLTAQEFMNTCAIPGSNGVDAYVFEVPAEYQKIEAQLEVTGVPGLPAPYDVDVYTFDSSCAQNSAQNATGTDAAGYLFKGTAYVLVHNFEPGPIDVQLTLKP